MIRPLTLVCWMALCVAAACATPVSVLASRVGSSPPAAYAPSVSGSVAGFRMAGIEPDGDPLDQVVLRTKLSASHGLPAVNLIIDAYLENFQPDTTPVLPDLLHPNDTAQNLGGFLQGKALLTDDAGNVLYIGSFLAEAFLNNTNHAVIRLFGSGAAYGGSGSLKGTFRLRKDGALSGAFTGHLALPAAARRQLIKQRGAHMKSVQRIISVVTVKPAPMKGKATTGSPNTPLHTGFGLTHHPASHPISTWTIVAGIGVIASLLLGAALFFVKPATSVE